MTQHPASHTQSSDLAESLSSSHLKPHTACCIPFSMPHMQPCRLGLHSLSCALHPSCKPHTPCCKPHTPCCTHLLMMSLRHLGPRLSTSITLPLAGLALFHTGLHTPQMPPCKPHIPCVRLPSHTVCVGDVFLQGFQQASDSLQPDTQLTPCHKPTRTPHCKPCTQALVESNKPHMTCYLSHTPPYKP